MESADSLIQGREVQRLAGGVCSTTLTRWVKAGHFPAPAIHTGSTRYWRASEVQSWIENASARPGAPKPRTAVESA